MEKVAAPFASDRNLTRHYRMTATSKRAKAKPERDESKICFGVGENLGQTIIAEAGVTLLGKGLKRRNKGVKSSSQSVEVPTSHDKCEYESYRLLNTIWSLLFKSWSKCVVSCGSAKSSTEPIKSAVFNRNRLRGYGGGYGNK